MNKYVRMKIIGSFIQENILVNVISPHNGIFFIIFNLATGHY